MIELQLVVQSGTTYTFAYIKSYVFLFFGFFFAFACIKRYVFSRKITRAVQRNGGKRSL